MQEALAHTALWLTAIFTAHGGLLAQQRTALDTPVSGEFRVSDRRAETRCYLATAVEQIARKANTPVGLENDRCNDQPYESVGMYRLEAVGDAWDFSGTTPRQALEELLKLDPVYLGKERNGILVIRPKHAWSDPANILNRPLQPFAVRDVLLGDVVRLALKSAVPSLYDEVHSSRRYHWRPMQLGSGSATDAINRPISLTFTGGTLLDALNELGKRQELNWQVGYNAQSARIVLSDLQLFTAGAMVSVETARLLPPR
jgi:hypothetical protein